MRQDGKVKLEVQLRPYVQTYRACMQSCVSRNILQLNAPTKPVCAADSGMLWQCCGAGLWQLMTIRCHAQAKDKIAGCLSFTLKTNCE